MGTRSQDDMPVAEMPRTLDEMADLRARGPVARVRFAVGGEAWVVLSHQHARELLADARLGRAPLVRQDVPHRAAFPKFLKNTLMFTDQPQHARLRRLVAKWFTARRVESYRDRTTAVAHRLIDDLEGAGAPADLIAGFAAPLPLDVLTNLLGVPMEHKHRFEEWVRVLLSIDARTAQQADAAMDEMAAYLTEAIGRKRAHPEEDLLSGLASVRDKDDSLTGEEILWIAMLVLTGGFDNTANAIGTGVYALLRHAEQRAVFQSDPDRFVTTLTEEVLRHGRQSVGEGHQVAGVPFLALEPIEFAGIRIEPGEFVVVHRTSANHDETVFDEPGRFDVTRSPNPHLGFSHGAHHCLGAPLARMELQVAFTTLFARLPDLAPAGEPRFLREMLSAPMAELPVRW
ncbi:cytochrome P450 [Thermocatellispora tengchongensis]|uniref:Cytochrome P450 n=1 Tax=Thermocatellispora tengchongensis TaxID=1073253 RepID=A0A840PDN9_9ACTN|nr:cytochrome P450 [Thermocatellispora tengchongensis]MBB5136846.1 cytochrome P450 [Thermocatellispora tengchongensis]